MPEPPPMAEAPKAEEKATAELRSSVRGSALLLTGRGIALSVEFAAHVIVVRYLTQEDYGAYSYALALASLFAGFLVLGLPETLARYAPIYLEGRQHWRLLGAIIVAITLILSIGAVAAGLVLLMPDLVGDALDSQDSARLLGILMLAVPSDGINLVFQGLFAALGRVRAIFFRQYVLVPGLRLIVALVLVLGDESVTFLAIGYVAVSLVGVLWYAAYAAPLLRRAVSGARQRIELPAREILSFALPVLLTNVFWIVLLAAGTIALGVLGSTTEVAEFQAVLPPARLNYLVTTIFSILFIPTISRLYARNDLAELRNAYLHTTYWLTALTIPLLALTTVFAPTFVPTFFGGEYDASIPILILLSAGYYVHSAAGPNSTTLKVFRRLRVTVIIDLVALALGIVLNLVLIPPAGAVGAALAFLLSVAARNAAYQIALRRVAGISLLTKDFGRLQFTIFASLAVLTAVQALLDPGIVVVVVLSALAGLLVVRTCRSMLDIEGTFPELARGPLRRLLSSDR